MPRTWPAWRVSTRNCSTHSNIGVKRARPTWPSSAPGRRWWVAAPS
jgi:hypothetical protein